MDTSIFRTLPTSSHWPIGTDVSNLADERLEGRSARRAPVLRCPMMRLRHLLLLLLPTRAYSDMPDEAHCVSEFGSASSTLERHLLTSRVYHGHVPRKGIAADHVSADGTLLVLLHRSSCSG